MRAFVFCAVFYVLASFCAASPLDDLVAREQANVDNEAVLAYGGIVGKLDAVFLIEWDKTNGVVEGYYYYPARGRERTYRLAGTNPKPGVLVLQEFSPKDGGGEVLSASCRLTKRVSGSRVIWEGTMNNTDGRVLPMSFSRAQ